MADIYHVSVIPTMSVFDFFTTSVRLDIYHVSITSAKSDIYHICITRMI